MPTDYAGNTFSKARSLNVTSNIQTFTDWVGSSDLSSDIDDYYKFSLSGRSSFNLSLTGLSADANVQLIRDVNSNGKLDQNEVIAGSYQTDRKSESIQTTLDAGNYLIRAYSAVGSTNYDLNISAQPEVSTSTNTADWTFMVYLDADNNLESYGILDFLEMAQVGSKANVNIVVQMDRMPGYDSRYGDWTDARRGLVRFGDQPTNSWGQSIGEVNMGAQSTLNNFVKWSMTNYKANNYALVLWDHGGGIDGICWDYTSKSDRLELKEVSDALTNLPRKLDLIGTDACLMGMTEFAHQIKNEASVLVASEELVAGQGWNYNTMLSGLVANSKMTAAEFGKSIVKSYGQYYGSFNTGIEETLSAIDLVKLRTLNSNNLSNSLSQFATTFMNASTSSDRSKLETYHANSFNFGGGYYATYRDLGSILNQVVSDANMTSSIRDAARMVLDAYNGIVISNYSSNGQASGLAINFQQRGKSYSSYYNSSKLAFAADTMWDEFLTWWKTA